MIAMHGADNVRPAAGATSDMIVRVDGLTKRYGRTVALDGVSLEIRPKELFALLGPNGAGKTTLIHILCTILAPDSGTVTLAGFDVARQPLKARRHLGVVFQEPSVDDRLTVFENLNFHGLVYQVPAALRRQRIDELLALVELEEWRHTLVRSLSSGMKRRVEIARALIHDSTVLILDEPTSGLDAQSRERIWAYLMRLRQERALTIIVTTHYIEEVEGCDRICIIDRGHILAIASVAAGCVMSGSAVYGATKAGVVAFCEGLRREVGRHGIAVTAILPGFIATPMTEGHPFPMPPASRVGNAVARLIHRPRQRVVIPGWYAPLMTINRVAPVIFDAIARRSPPP